MSHNFPLSVAAVLIAALLFAGPVTPVVTANAATPPSSSEVTDSTPQWNVWGADHYALADDDAAIWITGVGGVIRWDKQQSTHRRYTMLDGLPHVTVLAAAVDSAGNRWFGGDGGLSRFDPAETWTHFQSANSSLHTNYVDALATVGDTVYISHGLPDGSVDRRDADGSWRWYPNRETAIQSDYATIVQAGGSNALWTVAGTEVWVGLSVFDGQQWVDRTPSECGEVIGLDVDSQNHVWALCTADPYYYGEVVYEWNGAAWVSYPQPTVFTGEVTSLAVDEMDHVWVGLQERWGDPYSNEVATVREVTGANTHHLNTFGPVVALLATPEGLWGIGPGWLMRPGFSVTLLMDAPLYKDLPDAVAGRGGRLWFYSGEFAPYSVGAIQSLDDQGTMALEDDVWEKPGRGPNGEWLCEVVTAFERAGNDIWYTSYCADRAPMDMKAVRLRGDRRIEYPLPYHDVNDIFAVDQRHIWFAVAKYTGEGRMGLVLSLDDGGTPADLDDDTWQTIPIGAAEGKLSVAVDAKGVLWHGQEAGLFRYDGAAWQQVYGQAAVCDLAPAADGTLYLNVEPVQNRGCDERSNMARAVRPDGSVDQSHDTVADYVELETARVRTAARRNSLWAIAADGAVWYLSNYDGPLLNRRTVAGLETHRLPIPTESVRRLEVDDRGHVWLVDGAHLWRMEGPAPNRLYLPVLHR